MILCAILIGIKNNMILLRCLYLMYITRGANYYTFKSLLLMLVVMFLLIKALTSDTSTCMFGIKDIKNPRLNNYNLHV